MRLKCKSEKEEIAVSVCERYERIAKNDEKSNNDANFLNREIQWTNNTFQQFDIDGDNLLNPDEIRAYLRTTVNSDSDSIKEIIDPFDVDKNGQLRLEEFQKFEQNVPYHKIKPLPLPELSDPQ
ncbi:hypothetical protein QR680_004214 [Steinernema hermaphroditum]|uniref:EF-hand domain-containing protein n=1 Tax=Steinernema hermaphroditum TaxID=289476 RepID=A0AA39LTM7_9BILA|nr:hypothetical protein QR680_004214 [Steinernema hermaphroditum]